MLDKIKINKLEEQIQILLQEIDKFRLIVWNLRKIANSDKMHQKITELRDIVVFLSNERNDMSEKLEQLDLYQSFIDNSVVYEFVTINNRIITVLFDSYWYHNYYKINEDTGVVYLESSNSLDSMVNKLQLKRKLFNGESRKPTELDIEFLFRNYDLKFYTSTDNPDEEFKKQRKLFDEYWIRK